MSLQSKTILALLLSVTCVPLHAADIKLSLPIRNAQVNIIEPMIGENPVLRLCGGAVPSNVAAADGSTSFVRIVLPTDWATTSGLGQLVKVGEWQSVAKVTAPIGGSLHFRLYSSGGTVHMQGSVTLTGGGGVITIPSLPVAGQIVKINTFTITAGNEFGTVAQATNRLQYSTAIQNEMLDEIETVVGPNAIAKLLSGTPPATVAASDPGSIIATMPLGSDWMTTASAGITSNVNAWTDAAADLTGIPTHLRIFESNTTTPHLQGDVTVTAGSGLVKLSNINVVAGDTVTIPSGSVVLTSRNQ